MYRRLRDDERAGFIARATELASEQGALSIHSRPSVVSGKWWYCILTSAPVAPYVCVTIAHGSFWANTDASVTQMWRRRASVERGSLELPALAVRMLDEFLGQLNQPFGSVVQDQPVIAAVPRSRMDALEFGDRATPPVRRVSLEDAARLSLDIFSTLQYFLPHHTNPAPQDEKGWLHLAAVRSLLADALGEPAPRLSHEMVYDVFDEEAIACYLDDARAQMERVRRAGRDGA